MFFKQKMTNPSPSCKVQDNNTSGSERQDKSGLERQNSVESVHPSDESRTSEDEEQRDEDNLITLLNRQTTNMMVPIRLVQITS